jgi:hypothetical protein
MRGADCGTACRVKYRHDRRFVQVLQVKGGQPVRLRMWVRGQGASR